VVTGTADGYVRMAGKPAFTLRALKVAPANAPVNFNMGLLKAILFT
jgi:hypothetical protein